MLLVKGLVVSVLSAALMGVVLFVSAGTIQWPAGWIFLILVLVYSIIQMVDLNRSSPALLQQRLSPQKGAGFGYVLFLAWAVLMPIDAVRLHWSHMPLALQVIGGIILTGSFPLIMLTFRENAYAVPEVRVQAGQKVISTGPYRYVRHPLYGCGVLFVIGMPLLLGSWWGLLAGGVTIAYMAARARREERLLCAELPGYGEYMARVRCRFIPYVW